MTSQDLFQRFQTEFGEEYAKFLLSDFGPSPRLCPYCETETLRKLWLGDPTRKIDDLIWAKFYMWCESCLRGIYCPPGSYRVPKGKPYKKWGDEAALMQALPSGLQLIERASVLTNKEKMPRPK